jgi:hypothetical protein
MNEIYMISFTGLPIPNLIKIHSTVLNIKPYCGHLNGLAAECGVAF